jgi:flagellar biogenesis protein FliO
MNQEETAKATKNGPAKTRPIGGLAGWLLGRLRAARRGPARLAVLERITLAPRQSLSLIEAEGRRFLVATSPEGTPAFYALDTPKRESSKLDTASPVRSFTAREAAARSRTFRRNAARSGANREMRVAW